MKNILNKIVFGSSLFLSVLAFAETEEQKDPVPIDYENIRKGKYELIEDDLFFFSSYK